jgi:hypothetical protein
MTNIYERLKKYYSQVAEVLKGEASIASIFPNCSDIWMSRELTYIEFLKRHVPSKCNILGGGFIFDENGNESKQIDIIINADSSIQYNFQNKHGNGKSFSTIEGCLGIASIKSKLDKKQLVDSLENIASIPMNKPIWKRINPEIKWVNYYDRPYKIIYASDWIDGKTILNHINEFYKKNSNIPVYRKPNLIHVIGKYAIFRSKKWMSFIDTTTLKETKYKKSGEYNIVRKDDYSDLQALFRTVKEIQENSSIASHIHFDYSKLINKMFWINKY